MQLRGIGRQALQVEAQRQGPGVNHHAARPLAQPILQKRPDVRGVDRLVLAAAPWVPLADGRLTDLLGFGDLALSPALLLEAPGVESWGLFPVVGVGFLPGRGAPSPALVKVLKLRSGISAQPQPALA
jgi:hypothetical protein